MISQLAGLSSGHVLTLGVLAVVFGSVVGLVLGVVGIVAHARHRRRAILTALVRDLVASNRSVEDIRSILGSLEELEPSSHNRLQKRLRALLAPALAELGTAQAP